MITETPRGDMTAEPAVECGFKWIADDQPTPHFCRKPSRHVTDITNDEHRCCCGADTWSYDDE